MEPDNSPKKLILSCFVSLFISVVTVCTTPQRSTWITGMGSPDPFPNYFQRTRQSLFPNHQHQDHSRFLCILDPSSDIRPRQTSIFRCDKRPSLCHTYNSPPPSFYPLIFHRDHGGVLVGIKKEGAEFAPWLHCLSAGVPVLCDRYCTLRPDPKWE